MLEHIRERHGKYKKRPKQNFQRQTMQELELKKKKKKSILDGINSGFYAEKVKINGQKDMQ